MAEAFLLKAKKYILFPIILCVVAVCCCFAVFNTENGKQEACVSAEGDYSCAKIDILYGGRVFSYVDDFIEPTDHTVAETLQMRKINAPLPEKIRMTDRCIAAGATYKDAMLYCFPLLEGRVDEAVKFINKKPEDSTVKFNPDKRPMFSITREKVGYETDEEGLYRDIYLRLRRSGVVQVTVVPKTLIPGRTVYDNVKLTALRAKFTTDYSNSNENRKDNIRLALKKINGTVLKPDEEFSFNKKVGRRSEQNGFKEAKIIVGGEYVEGVGGGVCQASTTLYNCALRADMKITQARNHSLLSSYVPPSFDAMVNSGSSDLRFVNSGDEPVFIRAYGTDSEAVVEIYGTALPYKIKTESVVLSRSDPPKDQEIVDTEGKYIKEPMRPGEKLRVSYGHGAVKSEGYLLYYDAQGKLLERKLIRCDNYSQVAGIVAVAPETA